MNLQYSIEYAEMMIVRTQLILNGVSALQLWVYDLIVSVSGIFQCSFESAQVITMIVALIAMIVFSGLSLAMMIGAIKRFFRR